MKTKYLILYHCCEGKVVEQVSQVLPDIGIAVFAQALVVEAVDLGDLPALMVPPDKVDPVRVPHLQGQQEQEGLHAVEPTVNKVSHEEIVGVGNIATNLIREKNLSLNDECPA